MIKKHQLLTAFTILIVFILTACSIVTGANVKVIDPRVSVIPAGTNTPSATPFQPLTNTPVVIPPTYTVTPTFTPSSTYTPIPTATPLPTDTPIPTQTPVLQYNSGESITAPILLYHHVSDAGLGNRYYVTLDNFRAQMQVLKDLGYTSITPSTLVDVLFNGGMLPERPVIISFDDGNYDVYQYAFPIMHQYGFSGAFYIVADRLNSNNYVHTEQLQEMINDGWEIGSHSMTHADLTLDYSIVWYEMVQSRTILQEATGQNIDTFAYPYGKIDGFVISKASEYGYRAGMGLGLNPTHSLGTLFYLNRREIQGDFDISTFTRLLPWSDQ